MAETIVRLAAPADEAGVMALTNLIHEEIGLYHYSEDSVRTVVRKAVNQKMALIGVIGEPNDIRASLYLNFEPVWYSDEWHICELWNFVHPNYRREDYGSRLIRWAKGVADTANMNLLVGVLNNVRTEAKVRAYERLLPKAGAFFIYKPQKLEQVA